MTIRYDAFYNLYLLLSLDNVKDKIRHAFYIIVHSLRDTGLLNPID
jgi:hypothetical protein